MSYTYAWTERWPVGELAAESMLVEWSAIVSLSRCRR